MKKHLVVFLALVVVAGIGFKLISSKQPDLTVMGHIQMADGRGRRALELINAFKKQMKVNIKLTRKIRHIPKKFKKRISKRENDWGKVVIFEDVLWYPVTHSNVDWLRGSPKKSIRIARSMYTATRIPTQWVSILNSNFDVVVVPSPFLVKAYQDSGVEIPIFHVPLALNMRRLSKRPIKEKVGSPMVFANFSDGTDSKNHLLLIRAFHRAFGNDPQVELRLNFRCGEKHIRNQITKELAKLDVSNIRFTQKKLDIEDYIATLQAVDCYVSPSKGEGFSIEPREAMALGIPVIATNNTGQIPICKSGFVLGVETPIKQLALDVWGDCYGFNFTCTEEDLANAMIQMQADYDTYLGYAQEARDWAYQYSYDHLKPIYQTLIAPKEIVFGKENKVTESAIWTSSRELFDKYQKQFPKINARESLQDVFIDIYERAEWGTNEEGKGFSGTGSLLQYAGPYIDLLTKFLKEKKVASVVDLGCGDWTFSRHLDWSGIDYLGVDVVDFVIDQNKSAFAAENIRFVHGDATSFDFPKADLLVCKDVLQHLSNQDVQKVLEKLGQFKHCLLINDIDLEVEAKGNYDIAAGGCRTIDLTAPPFNLKAQELLRYDALGTRKVVLYYQPKERADDS